MMTIYHPILLIEDTMMGCKTVTSNQSKRTATASRGFEGVGSSMHVNDL